MKYLRTLNLCFGKEPLCQLPAFCYDIQILCGSVHNLLCSLTLKIK